MNTINSHYSIANKGHDKAIVFIHGLFTNRRIFERSIGSIEGHTCIFIDLFSLAQTGEHYDLQVITKDLVQILDELNIKGAIFVAKGIGKDIAFQIGIERPDLIKGQIFIGTMNNQLNPLLKSAELELFKYMKDNEEDKGLVSLLEDIMNISNNNNAQCYANELISNIKHEAFISLYENMRGKRHFSKMEYWNNTIPNVFIVPDSTSSTAMNLNYKVGYNKSVLKVDNISTDWELVFSDSFSMELKRSLSYFQG